MIEQNGNRFALLAEKLGLDWIPILFDDSKFPKSPRPSQDRESEIQTYISTHFSVSEPHGERGITEFIHDSLSSLFLVDQSAVPKAESKVKSLEEIALKFEKMLAEEDARRIGIESKAYTLIGSTGIAAGFITGFAQFLFANESLSGGFRLLITTVYIFIGISLLMTILIANRAVQMGKYSFRQTKGENFLKLGEWTRDHFYQRYVAQLLISYEFNHALDNDKGTYVIGAQDWFRNTVILLLVLLSLLSVSPYLNSPKKPEPTYTIIITPANIPTITPTSTFTPTVTPNPTALPTVTGTPTPLPTFTLTPTPQISPTVSINATIYP